MTLEYVIFTNKKNYHVFSFVREQGITLIIYMQFINSSNFSTWSLGIQTNFDFFSHANILSSVTTFTDMD